MIHLDRKEFRIFKDVSKFFKFKNIADFTASMKEAFKDIDTFYNNDYTFSHYIAYKYNIFCILTKFYLCIFIYTKPPQFLKGNINNKILKQISIILADKPIYTSQYYENIKDTVNLLDMLLACNIKEIEMVRRKMTD
jgi:hypothetical protein